MNGMSSIFSPSLFRHVPCAWTLRPPSSLFSCCPYPKLKSAAIVSLNAENVSSSSGSFPPAAHRTLSRIFSSWLSPQTLQSSPTHERFFFVIYSSLLSSQTLQSSPTHKVTRCLWWWCLLLFFQKQKFGFTYSAYYAYLQCTLCVFMRYNEDCASFCVPIMYTEKRGVMSFKYVVWNNDINVPPKVLPNTSKS